MEVREKMSLVSKEDAMDREFEDEFMDAQSQIISLCVEFAGNRADKVYAYSMHFSRLTVRLKQQII